MKAIDLTGQTIGRLKIICQAPSQLEKNGKNGIRPRRVWYCECECGNKVLRDTAELRSCRTKAKSCGCWQREIVTSRSRILFGDLHGGYICQIRNAAKRRNLEFSVSGEYLWELYLQQNKRCALTGVLIDFGKPGKKGIRKAHMGGVAPTASLDRIDSGKAYVPGNVRWLHKTVNKIRWELSDDELLSWCNLILEHTRSTYGVAYENTMGRLFA